jgi:plasmid stabilization system protein ParE
MKIIWTDLAISRLSEIHRYIYLDSSVEADKWLVKLLNYSNLVLTIRHVKQILPVKEI